MQLPTMPTEKRRVLHIRHRRLGIHHLARIPLVDLEPTVGTVQVNTDGLELGGDGTVVPSCENAACVGAKGDDVAELFEGWEGFVDGDAVSLSVTFYRGSKTTKPWNVRVRFGSFNVSETISCEGKAHRLRRQ